MTVNQVVPGSTPGEDANVSRYALTKVNDEVSVDRTHLIPPKMRVSPSRYGTTLPMWNRVGSRPTTRSISESDFRVKHTLAVTFRVGR